MADPKRTVALLDQLVAMGFPDEAFQRLHHMGSRVTILVHRAYCEKRSTFQKDSTNARVELRLEFVFRKYRAGSFPPGRVEIFKRFADEAVAELSFNAGGKHVTFEPLGDPRVTPPNVVHQKVDSAFHNLSDDPVVVANRRARSTGTVGDISASVQNWIEFESLAAKAVRCRVCFDLGEVKPALITRAQPRWVGPRYWETSPRIMIVLLNPGSGANRTDAADGRFLSLLDAFATNRGRLAAIMDHQADDILNWGGGKCARFYLEGLGLKLEKVAFANVAWCATKENDYPLSMRSRCFALHTLPSATVLAPHVLLLSGSDTHRFASAFQDQLPDTRIVPMLHYARRKDLVTEKAELVRVRRIINKIQQHFVNPEGNEG